MNKYSDFNRILVLGNSGSGKSWLSDRLSTTLATQVYDLDNIHWEPEGYNVARDKQAAIRMVRHAATGERWIIEGVYGWLAQEAVSRTTTLVWLDIPVNECLENLKQRGLRRGGSDESFAALLDWAADYPNRETSSSFIGHEQMFLAFSGQKYRLSSRGDVGNYLASTGHH